MPKLWVLWPKWSCCKSTHHLFSCSMLSHWALELKARSSTGLWISMGNWLKVYGISATANAESPWMFFWYTHFFCRYKYWYFFIPTWYIPKNRGDWCLPSLWMKHGNNSPGLIYQLGKTFPCPPPLTPQYCATSCLCSHTLLILVYRTALPSRVIHDDFSSAFTLSAMTETGYHWLTFSDGNCYNLIL